jgi:CHAD domain-containing protein
MKDWESILIGALRQQWRRYRKALKRCQKHFSEKTVHESRVESRRLLVQFELLAIFGPARLSKRARRALEWHRNLFDALRDTQVQLSLLKRHQRAFPETKALRDALRRREKRCRKQAARRILQIKTGRLKKLVTAILRQMETARRDPERQVRERKAILRAVDMAFARLMDRRRHMDPGHVATIHRTRVAFKKFRYMVEALQPLFREISPARLRSMQSFQSLLGRLQDTDVFLARIDKFTRKDRNRAQPLAQFRHWLLGRRTKQIQHSLDRADVILKFWPLRDDAYRLTGSTHPNSHESLSLTTRHRRRAGNSRVRA